MKAIRVKFRLISFTCNKRGLLNMVVLLFFKFYSKYILISIKYIYIWNPKYFIRALITKHFINLLFFKRNNKVKCAIYIFFYGNLNIFDEIYVFYPQRFVKYTYITVKKKTNRFYWYFEYGRLSDWNSSKKKKKQKSNQIKDRKAVWIIVFFFHRTRTKRKL